MTTEHRQYFQTHQIAYWNGNAASDRNSATRADVAVVNGHCQAKMSFAMPAEAANLERGGIIGSVEVADVVKSSGSPWFFGPRGLVLRDPIACPFISARGALGYFRWIPANDRQAESPPLIFETMIFGGEHDEYMQRCSTWDEAEAQHSIAVRLVEEGEK